MVTLIRGITWRRQWPWTWVVCTMKLRVLINGWPTISALMVHGFSTTWRTALRMPSSMRTPSAMWPPGYGITIWRRHSQGFWKRCGRWWNGPSTGCWNYNNRVGRSCGPVSPMENRFRTRCSRVRRASPTPLAPHCASPKRWARTVRIGCRRGATWRPPLWIIPNCSNPNSAGPWTGITRCWLECYGGSPRLSACVWRGTGS